MDAVQIQVVDKDGKYRGGLFRLGRGEHIWHGKSKANPAESMVCLGPLETGAWFLIELVHREGASEHDESAIILSASRACRRMPVQALQWFMRQEIGAPPALAKRVAQFRKDWAVFRDSASAKAKLAAIVRRKDVSATAGFFSGPKVKDDLSLLLRLELLHTASSGRSTSYMADSVVEDMGVTACIAWVDEHLERITSHEVARRRQEVVAGLHPEHTVVRAARQHRRTDKKAIKRSRKAAPRTKVHLSNMAMLVLRALPESTRPALRTLESIAAKVDVSPRPSVSSMSRAIASLREQRSPLVAKECYRRTKAGDAMVSRSS